MKEKGIQFHPITLLWAQANSDAKNFTKPLERRRLKRGTILIRFKLSATPHTMTKYPPTLQHKQKYRVKRQPRRVNENSGTKTAKNIIYFFKMEFNEVLDVQLQQFGYKLSQYLQDIKPLYLLQLPLKEPPIEEIHDLVIMFPQNVTVDPQALHAEIGNFINHVKVIGKELVSVADAANFQQKEKEFFHLRKDVICF